MIDPIDAPEVNVETDEISLDLLEELAKLVKEALESGGSARTKMQDS
ncbi:MAG TPA: hypothetical protein VMT00_11670 [Thermoanaerobaculia bacterium]|nr:hypothetical protein [Thermoanaerobaculia bacterium]